MFPKIQISSPNQNRKSNQGKKNEKAQEKEKGKEKKSILSIQTRRELIFAILFKESRKFIFFNLDDTSFKVDENKLVLHKLLVEIRTMLR